MGINPLEKKGVSFGKEVKHSGGTSSQCPQTLAESIQHFQLFLASPSCPSPCQLLLLPLTCPCCLQPCLRSPFQPLSSPIMFSLAGSGCVELWEASPRPCLHPGLFQRNPPRRVCDSSQRHSCPELGGTRWKNENYSSQRFPPALAVSGVGCGTLDHGSISPPPQQTAFK